MLSLIRALRTKTFVIKIGRYFQSANVPNENCRHRRIVGYWLLTCSGMVFGAVTLGGLTRLTESGLSMVNWKLLGEQLPRSNDQWLAEFHKYQQFPEFKIKNREITLNEFKFIWYMEFGHRMWGRLIGAVYLLPALYFWQRKMFPDKLLKRKVVFFGTLILMQGLMGWYMVKSGLDETNFQGTNDVPRVSQYRLAAHLSFAVILYLNMLQTSFELLDRKLPVVDKLPLSKLFRFGSTVCIKSLILLTIVSGAFVAGLDAGLTYNSFPKMADKWIPDDILAIDKPSIWRNFTENPTTVQFNHRILGISTFTLSMLIWIVLQRKSKAYPRLRYASATLAAVALLQATLGISTLLMYVPIELAAAHQSNSLILLSTAIWLSHELKKFPK